MSILRKEKRTELSLRAISSAAIVSFVASSIFAGELYFYVCLSILSAGMMHELLSVARVKYSLVFTICVAVIQFCSLHLDSTLLNHAFFCVFVMLAVVTIFDNYPVALIIVQLAVFVFCNKFFRTIMNAGIIAFVLFWKRDCCKKINLKHQCIVLLGSVYIFASMHMLGKIYNKFGLILVCWIFLCVWLTDTGAFFIGKIIGGKKLAPQISPGKTWAGFWGGVLVAEIVCVTIGLFIVPAEHLYKIGLLTMLMSVFANIGDLVESSIKRYFNVKDMGQLIPGHGGLMDRFDSLLMVSLMLSVVLYNF